MILNCLSEPQRLGLAEKMLLAHPEWAPKIFPGMVELPPSPMNSDSSPRSQGGTQDTRAGAKSRILKAKGVREIFKVPDPTVATDRPPVVRKPVTTRPPVGKQVVRLPAKAKTTPGRSSHAVYDVDACPAMHPIHVPLKSVQIFGENQKYPTPGRSKNFLLNIGSAQAVSEDRMPDEKPVVLEPVLVEVESVTGNELQLLSPVSDRTPPPIAGSLLLVKPSTACRVKADGSTEALGMGLFARRPYLKGEKVCEFKGDIIDNAEFLKRQAKAPLRYCVYISKNKYMDSEHSRECLAKFVNSFRGAVVKGRGLSRENCELHTHPDGRAWYVATMDIPGSLSEPIELFTDYGEDYKLGASGSRNA
jgi:hypothetical protein